MFINASICTVDRTHPSCFSSNCRYFGSLSSSILTLYSSMSGGEDWTVQLGSFSVAQTETTRWDSNEPTGRVGDGGRLITDGFQQVSEFHELSRLVEGCHTKLWFQDSMPGWVEFEKHISEGGHPHDLTCGSVVETKSGIATGQLISKHGGVSL